MIAWEKAENYDSILKKSKEIDKPILLDLFSENCKGCMNLEKEVYSNPEIANLINKNALTLRVFTDNPDRSNTTLINNHIYIWSPTVQMLASDGTRYHEFYGAPRQTRYSVCYDKTHHEIDGDLNPKGFVAQFIIALGKRSLKKKEYTEAKKHFQEVIANNQGNTLVLNEAKFWLKVAENNGKVPQSNIIYPIMKTNYFSACIDNFKNKAVKLADSELMVDWPGKLSDGDWHWYTDSLKEVFLQTYQKLYDFHLHVGVERAKMGKSQTMAQKILANFHLCYREFQSSLIGVKDDELDLMTFKGERSLRENVAHCVLSEWWAHSPQIRHAVELKRKNQAPSLMPGTNTLEKFGQPVGTFESLGELLSRYEELHNKLLLEFSSITDDELKTVSKWWEPEPVQVSFRLKRLGWHLRDHRVSLEKIQQEIGHRRSEIERFCQLLYTGLGIAEGSLIGMDENHFRKEMQSIVSFVEDRAKELSALKTI